MTTTTDNFKHIWKKQKQKNQSIHLEREREREKKPYKLEKKNLRVVLKKIFGWINQSIQPQNFCCVAQDFFPGVVYDGGIDHLVLHEVVSTELLSNKKIF